MSYPFHIKEHVIECQHIREYARATSQNQEEILHLAVKQYIPKDNPSPKDGDFTIIGAHANGSPKELYEPFWGDLYARSKNNGFSIRSIWIAEMAQQGASGVLNEQLLGDDPSWLDHARDLLYLINQFRAEMPLPIVGFGHSLGANILANLALMHPRLLTTIIMVDPVIQVDPLKELYPNGPNPAQASTFRRDIWPSRAAAEAAFRKAAVYQKWDKRVFERWLKYGIRETPTSLYPEEQGAVTLTTTKHQENFTFLRPGWKVVNEAGVITDSDEAPDMRLGGLMKTLFYRPEPPNILAKLPELRPSVCYIFGGSSPLSTPRDRKLKLEVTGVGVGGSGGVNRGRVKEVLLEGVDHLVAMEASERCADAAAPWLGQELRRFTEEKEKYLEWTKQSHTAKTTMSDEWKARIGRRHGEPSDSKL